MKKGRGILLCICIAFLALTAGVFLGRNLPGQAKEIPATEVIEATSDHEQTEDLRPDINDMSKAQLMTIPGIGETLAERIVKYREANGPYRSMDELLNVEGIGEKKLQQIADVMKVGGNHEDSSG